MIIKNFRENRALVLKLLNQQSGGVTGSLLPAVKALLKKKQKLLNLASKYQTPFYVIDKNALSESIELFTKTFNKHLPNNSIFYAVKSNYHPCIIRGVLKYGLGLDVSSERELKIALRNSAKKIIYSGPGKTNQGLRLALKHSRNIIINVDNFNELKRLGGLTEKYRTSANIGVRCFTGKFGAWTKFGIPLESLLKFYQATKQFKRIKFSGIQCHKSWNPSSKDYEDTIKSIGTFLQNNSNHPILKAIKFIDLGGGFWPHLSDGYYPWDLPAGQIINIANKYFNKKPQFTSKYYISDAVPLSKYAEGIAGAVDKYLRPIINCLYYFEPGRIISNNSTMIVLRVVDTKSPKMAIVDGGINIVGWDRFLNNYYPLINLTNPSLEEISYKIYGSLCDPDDIWGYYCYAKSIKEGDVILVPFQGAYAYTLAQNFIKPIPKSYILK